MKKRRGHALGARRSQGGWVGIVVLVLALLIVAMLSRTVLDQYLGGTVTRGGASSTSGGQGGSGSPDPNAASTPMPSRAPMERARAVNDLVQQQSAETRKRVEAAEK